jgi:transposase
MGHTDVRNGMQGLALIVQQALRRNPFAGDLYVFRGRAGSLVKVVSGTTGSGCRFRTTSRNAVRHRRSRAPDRLPRRSLLHGQWQHDHRVV